ncbi:MAG: glutamine synthetase beta-grasp domain-containing protein, partial [Ktedonobacterales bacterium]
MAMTPDEVVRFAKDHGVRMVDVKFTDVPGTWQHFSVPMSSFDVAAFDEGIGFDGSSIRGWQAINE